MDFSYLKHLVPFFVIALLALIAIELLRRIKRPGALPYRRKDPFFSPAERAFYEVLLRSLQGTNLIVFAKVRLCDLLCVQPNTRDEIAHFNRISAKHVDFVLCDRPTLTPRLVIELDDRSHQRADRVARDAFVDRVLEGSGLPILRVTCRRDYDVRELRREIESRMSSMK